MNAKMRKWLATVLACLMLTSMTPDVGALNAALAEGEQVAEEQQAEQAPTDAPAEEPAAQETAVPSPDLGAALAPSDAVIPVTSIRLNTTSKTLSVRDTFQLTSTVTPGNASDPSVTWSSDKESVATVDDSGLVTAVGAGKAVVTATASSGAKAQCTFTVKTVPVTKLTVAPATLTLDVGEKQTLAATVLPANATVTDVTWSGSKGSIAQVDRLTGEVTGIGNGTATITATTTDGSKKTATCKVTVAALAKGFTLGGPKTVTSGGSITLTATFDPANTANKSLNWVSDKTAAATVSSSGVVTAKTVAAATDVTITATTKDGTALSETYIITVLPKATGVRILKEGQPASAATIDLSDADKTLQLTAEVAPDDASGAVTWSTSNKKTATVDGNGLVTGVAAGTVTITATTTDGSKKSATLTLTVAALSRSVTITGSSTMTAGGTTTLKAAVLPATATNKAVAWTSSDNTIATVSSAGVVTAKTVAQTKTVTITATAKDGSGASFDFEIAVYPKSTGVTILVEGEDKTSASIDLAKEDKTLVMTATVSPDDANQTVDWKSSNTKVAKVQDGVVTGLTAGTTTITATAKDGSGKSDSVAVTVAALVQSVTISGAQDIASGGTTTLTASVLPTTATNKAVTWTSSDTAIATVSATGVVTAKPTTVQKTVTIKATAKDSSGASFAFDITVYPKATSVTILVDGEDKTAATIDLSQDDKTLTMTAAVLPIDAMQGVNWNSSNTKVASVNGGVVTGLTAGTTTITATAKDGSGKSDSVTVTVAMLVKSVEIVGSDEMTAGNNLSLSVNILPANATNKAVTWTSSDTAIATVSTSGVVTAKATTEQKTVTIKATAKDGSGAFDEHEITVYPKATGVTILVEGEDKAAATIDLSQDDKTLDMTATVSPADAMQGVNWISSNTKVARVDGGVVTGIAAGTTTITATAKDGSGKSDSVTVTVATLVQSVEIVGSDGMMSGGTLQLSVNILPANATNKALTWTSSDNSVAAVSATGMVTAKATNVPKTVTITATAKDGSGAFDEQEITVTPKVTSVTILLEGEEASAASIDLGLDDPTLSLEAVVKPDDAMQDLDWKSSNEKVATVDGGMVTGLTAGTTTITATAKDGSKKSASLLLTVAVMVQDISIDGKDEMTGGTTTQLTATLTPGNATNKGVTWSTSDSSVATVSSTGLVTAKTVSEVSDVTITATAKGGTDIFFDHVITVYPKPTGVSIQVDGEPATKAQIDLSTDALLQLTADVQPADAMQNVTWQSSDDSVVEVDQDGLLTGNKRGTATITATTADGSKSAHCQITVTALVIDVAIDGATELSSGQKITLTAIITPDTAANKTVKWESEDVTVATVNSSGVVTALAVDSASPVTITATTMDGSGITAYQYLTVLPVAKVVRILLNDEPATPQEIYLGNDDKTVQLMSEVSPEDASQTMRWWSSAPTVASVDPDSGLVTGLSAGTAIIYVKATDGSEVTSSGVTFVVKDGLPPASLAVDQVNLPSAAVYAGESAVVSADASGGIAPYRYRYVFCQGTATILDSGIVADRSFNFVLPAGDYTLTATVYDSLNASVTSLEQSLSVRVHARVSAVASEADFGVAGEPIVWTASGSGNGQLSWNYEIYRDGVKIDAVGASLDGNALTYTPEQGGTYEARFILTDELSEVGALKGGAVAVRAFRWTPALQSIALGGVSSGLLGTFGPDDALPAGITVTYQLLHDEGDAATLSIDTAASTPTTCAIHYTEAALGTARYQLTYTVYDGEDILAQKTEDISVAVVAETDLPTGITAGVAEFTGAAGTPIAADTAGVSLTGGSLLPGDLTYSLRDDSGEAVLAGLTAQFANPGRYRLELVGSYQGSEWTCPVTFVVADEDGNAFKITLDPVGSAIYGGAGAAGHMDGRYAGLTTNAVLRDGEKLTWTIERVSCDAAADIAMALDTPTGDANAIQITAADGVGSATFRVTARGSGAYAATRTFAVTLSNAPDDLPDSIRYIGGDTFTRPENSTFKVRWADIAGVGGTIPAEAVYGVDVQGPMQVTPSYDTEGVSLKLDAVGDYAATLRVRVANLVWMTPLTIHVAQTGTIPFLSVNRNGGALYLGQSPTGYLATVLCDEVSLGAGEHIAWTLSRLSGPDGVVDLRTEYQSDGILRLIYSNIKSAGEVVYRVTASINGDPLRAAYVDIPVRVESSTPADMPKGISYVTDTVHLTAGVRWHMNYSDIRDQDGKALPDYVGFTFDVPIDAYDTLDRDATGISLLFTTPGRYALGILGHAGNVYFEDRITILVGDVTGGSIHLETGLLFSTVYPSGGSGLYLGSILADAINLSEGEESRWSIERISGDAADVGLVDPSSNRASMELRGVKPVTQDQEVTFLVTCRVEEDYQGSAEFTLTVKAAAPDALPKGIRYPVTEYHIALGESVAFHYPDITGVDAPLPEGVWHDVYGIDWENWRVYDTQYDRIITFTREGRFTLSVVAGYGNYLWESAPIVVYVGDGVGEYDMNLSMHSDHVYADCDNDNGYVCSLGMANMDGVTLLNGEHGEWSVRPADGETNHPAELYIEWSEDYQACVSVKKVTGLGAGRYVVSYTAADGLYHAEKEFSITVEEKTPDGAPTGIAYDQEPLVLAPGDTRTFRTSDIRFVGGEVPEGITPYFGLDMSDNMYDTCDVQKDGDAFTVTFLQEGRYYVRAMAGYASYEFGVCVPVVVKSAATEFGLDVYQKAHVVYADAKDPDYNIGAVFPRNFKRMDDEQVQWSIERIDSNPGTPITLKTGYINEDDPFSSIDYEPGTGVGTVVYRVTMTAAGYSASADVTVQVVDGIPEDYPRGIVAAGLQAQYNIQVGESLSFDRASLSFESGNPDGHTVWRDFWNDDGDWGSVEENWQDDVRINTFHNPGRYILYAVIGAENVCYRMKMVIIVGADESGHLDPGLDLYQRAPVLYGDEDRGMVVADFDLANGFVRDWEGEDFHWTLERLDGGSVEDAPVELYLESEEATHASIGYKFKTGESGQVHYRIYFEGVGGLYQSSREFTVSVVKDKPEGLPTAMAPIQKRYDIPVGGTVRLDPDTLQFEDGQVPDGMTVFREFWYDEGDWGSIEERGEDDVRVITFRNAGRYIVNAVIGIGNYVIDQPIEIVVGAVDGHLDPGLNLYQRAPVLYGDEERGMVVADFDLANGFVRDWAGEDFHWTLERLDGGSVEDAPVELYIENKQATHVSIGYTFKTREAGVVHYRIHFEAVGGLYQSSREFSVKVVKNKPEGLPTAMAPILTRYNILVGETVRLDPDTLQFDGGQVPDGAVVFREFWYADGDWGSIEEHGEDDVRVITFRNAGRYIVNAVIGIGNHVVEQPIEIVVGAVDGHLDPGLNLYQRAPVLYGDETQGINVAEIDLANGFVRDWAGEDFHWALERLDGGSVEDAPVELYIDNEQTTHASIGYRLKTGESGVVHYRIRYDAVGGLYQSSREFSVEVVKNKPEGIPTAMAPIPTRYSIPIGGMVTLDRNTLQFAGEVPEGAVVFREFWNAEGDWGSVEERWDKEVRTNTFRKAGRYIVNAVIGIGNHMIQQPVEIVVGADESGHLDPGLNVYLRAPVLYGDETNGINIAEIDLASGFVRDWAGEDFHWTLERLDGGSVEDAPVELSVNNEQATHASIGYRFKTRETGVVHYRIHFEAVGGLYQSSQEFTVGVVKNKPEGLPTAMASIPTRYDIPIGGMVTLDRNTLQFAGEVPEGAVVFREFWYAEGDWGSVEEHGEGDVRVITFRKAGRYIVNAVIGIGNHMVQQTVEIVVGAVQGHLDPGLGLYLRAPVLYGDESKGMNVAEFNLMNGVVRDWAGEDFHWTLERLDGGSVEDAPVELYIENEQATHASIGYGFKTRESGVVHYRIRYEAVGGLYQASQDFSVTVVKNKPEGLPTAMVPITTRYDIPVGGQVRLDPGTLQFVGEVPEGAVVFRDFWNAEGDWGSVEMQWDKDVRTDTFHGAGRYIVNAVIGIGNHMIQQTVEIVVGADESGHLDPGLNVYLRAPVLYGDETRGIMVTDINVENVLVRAGEDQHWTLERLDGGDIQDAPVELSIDNEQTTHVGIGYTFRTGESGVVHYRIRYDAVGGLYQSSREFSVEVVKNKPEGIPTAMAPIQTRYDISVGDMVELNPATLQFADGTVPEGAVVFRDFWKAEGDWGSVEERWYGDVRSETFLNAGRYIVNAVIGIGNHVIQQTMEIVVGADESGHLDPGLNVYLRAPVLYGDETQGIMVVDINVENVLVRAEDDHHWTLERLDGGDIQDAPVELYIDNEQATHVGIGYTFRTGESGVVHYRIRYDAAGGLYQSSREFSVEVVKNKPEDLPTAMAPIQTRYDISVGDTVTLDRATLQFANGTVPEGAVVFRDFWGAEGDWGKVEERWDKDVRTDTFRSPGRYVVYAVIGIGNHVIQQPIDIVVGADGEGHLNSSLWVDRIAYTVYTDHPESKVADVFANNVYIVDDLGDDYHWSIERLGGGDPADDPIRLECGGEGRNYVGIGYQIVKGGSGTVTYRITYDGAKGLYHCSQDITVVAEAQTPAGMPSGIVVPQTRYDVTTGGSIIIDSQTFDFAEGTPPAGLYVKKMFWTSGDWNGVKQNWSDTRASATFTFEHAGTYELGASINIGNYWYNQTIVVVVQDAA